MVVTLLPDHRSCSFRFHALVNLQHDSGVPVYLETNLEYPLAAARCFALSTSPVCHGYHDVLLLMGHLRRRLYRP